MYYTKTNYKYCIGRLVLYCSPIISKCDLSKENLWLKWLYHRILKLYASDASIKEKLYLYRANVTT